MPSDRKQRRCQKTLTTGSLKWMLEELASIAWHQSTQRILNWPPAGKKTPNSLWHFCITRSSARPNFSDSLPVRMSKLGKKWKTGSALCYRNLNGEGKPLVDTREILDAKWACEARPVVLFETLSIYR